MNVKELATFYQAAIMFNAQGWEFIKEKKKVKSVFSLPLSFFLERVLFFVDAFLVESVFS